MGRGEPMNRITLSLLASLIASSAGLPLAGCRGATQDSPPIVPLRNMHEQQRYDPQEYMPFFRDGRSMREPVAGTFAQEMIPELTLSEGRLNDDSAYVLSVPDEAYKMLGGAESAVERGQGRYNIYCAPCHDQTGGGQGTVIERGMAQPPSLHDGRIRTMPDGQLFATISNGIRNMPPYQHSIPVADRWAIVSYVRALQLSQANAGE